MRIHRIKIIDAFSMIIINFYLLKLMKQQQDWQIYVCRQKEEYSQRTFIMMKYFTLNRCDILIYKDLTCLLNRNHCILHVKVETKLPCLRNKVKLNIFHFILTKIFVSSHKKRKYIGVKLRTYFRMFNFSCNSHNSRDSLHRYWAEGLLQQYQDQPTPRSHIGSEGWEGFLCYRTVEAPYNYYPPGTHLPPWIHQEDCHYCSWGH